MYRYSHLTCTIHEEVSYPANKHWGLRTAVCPAFLTVPHCILLSECDGPRNVGFDSGRNTRGNVGNDKVMVFIKSFINSGNVLNWEKFELKHWFQEQHKCSGSRKTWSKRQCHGIQNDLKKYHFGGFLSAVNFFYEDGADFLLNDILILKPNPPLKTAFKVKIKV